MSRFLGLPREIRDAIYEHYVHVEDGYVCESEGFISSCLKRKRNSEVDPSTPRPSSSSSSSSSSSIAGVLKRADGLPIDLGLMYACKLTAREMEGVALRENTITFSTVTSDDIRVAAARFDRIMMDCLDRTREHMMHFAAHTVADQDREHLARRYPQFEPLLDRMRADDDGASDDEQGGRHAGGPFHAHDVHAMNGYGPYGEAPSLYRALRKDALEHMSLSRARRRRARERWPVSLETASDDRQAVAGRCSLQHWSIPSDDEMACLASGLWEDPWVIEPVIRRRDRTKYRFSAAAVAIQFLRHFPPSLRTHLRRIVLDEDREAVADAPCHALGLIPFCKQSPLLRIERRVSLWRNALLRDHFYHRSATCRYREKYRYTPWGLDSNQISKNVGRWMVEALALIPAGMPPKSFSLVLDGQPDPQRCAQIFQLVVQRDAAWQSAWTESQNRGILPALSWPVQRFQTPLDMTPAGLEIEAFQGYIFERFPKALEDMAKNNSIIRCNFDLGETWDVERIIHEHEQWTHEKWAEEWAKHEPAVWQPEAPLPDLRGIYEENHVPVPDDYETTDSESEEDGLSEYDPDSDSDEE